MQNITNAADLKNYIQLLEVEQAIKGELLQDQFRLTYESLRPINLIKSTLKDITRSPYLIDGILGVLMGLGSGFIAKKFIVGTSGNLFRKILGSVLKFTATSAVANNTDTIRSIGQYILGHIFKKKQ